MEIRILPSCRLVAKAMRAANYTTQRTASMVSVRQLHSVAPSRATPVAYPNVAGPPPQPPQVAAGEPEDTTARKQRQAEMVQQGQALKNAATKPASGLQKRFWKDVHVKEVEDGLQIMLDSRPVRTATKAILKVPRNKKALATSIAMEWDALVSAQQALKYHYIPMTSLTSRAVDVRTADAEQNPKIREEIIKVMMRYLETDTLLCWAPEHDAHNFMGTQGAKEPGQNLRKKQIAIAEPIIAHLKTHVFPGVEFEPILDEDSIMPREQPEATKQVIQGWLQGLPAFELAALERAMLATKSLLVAVRLLVDWSKEFQHIQTQDSKFGINEAAEASTVEVRWQTDMWGEVDDTHDVEREDLARQLGSVILLLS